MRVCASARMSALHAWAHMYMHAYVHACVCSRTCVGTGMYMQACVCVCVHHLYPYPPIFFFEAVSCCVVQVGLEVTTFLLQPLECWHSFVDISLSSEQEIFSTDKHKVVSGGMMESAQLIPLYVFGTGVTIYVTACVVVCASSAAMMLHC